ncbi:hypothetical protein FGB62_139g020 [Gracilaria domingensis]|nr:hypothetical protein FGB62_139g020 [Gracilaria domingensis]
MPEMVVQLLRSVDGSLEIIYIWFSLGDKKRDYYRTIVANVAEGHLLINQVKSVVGREGYVCTQDYSQEEILQMQKQKRLNQISKSRQAAAALTANAQNPQVPRPAYTAKHLQEQFANGVAAQVAGDAHKNSVVDVFQAHDHHAQSKARIMKESQKLMQRSQQMQKRRQQQQQHHQHQQEQIRRQQQHQILREQTQRQGHLHPKMQHQQPTSRIKAQVAQIGRMDKNGMNLHRPTASITNQIQAMVSKGAGQPRSNVEISQGLIDSMGLRNANIANLGMSTNVPHSQMFPRQQLQQLQQQLRQRQLQQQQRGLMGHASHAPNSYGRRGNSTPFSRKTSSRVLFQEDGLAQLVSAVQQPQMRGEGLQRSRW